MLNGIAEKPGDFQIAPEYFFRKGRYFNGMERHTQRQGNCTLAQGGGLQGRPIKREGTLGEDLSKLLSEGLAICDKAD
jgi:hypothetical protein